MNKCILQASALSLKELARARDQIFVMTADKVFEALSSAPRRRILAYLSKADMTAGQIVERFKTMRCRRVPIGS